VLAHGMNMMPAKGRKRRVASTRTDLVGKSCEDRASGAACEPENERVIAGAALRADEVVEEVDAIALVHLHVPVCMAATGKNTNQADCCAYVRAGNGTNS